jgi:hypothetical protein
MAGTGSSRGTDTAPLQSTKRLLDELDALMDKMLALPVGERDEALAEPDFPRLPKVSATLTVLEQAPEAAQPDPSLVLPAPTLVPMSRLDAPADFAAPHQDFSAEAESRPQDVPADAIPPSLLHVKVPDIEPLAIGRRALGTIIRQPLLWINGLFDLATYFLGPLGRLLRTPRGRNVLGLCGVGLIVLAVGWLLRDWLSWTR